jgi:stage II sporulation protein D
MRPRRSSASPADIDICRAYLLFDLERARMNNDRRVIHYHFFMPNIFMPYFFVTLALLTLTGAPVDGSSSIRINLFSLLKPEILEVRVSTGAGAAINVGGMKSNSRILMKESIRIRQSGSRLNLAIIDSYGRIKDSFTATEAEITPAEGATLELGLPGKIKRVVRGRVSVIARHGPMQIVLATDRESAVASMVAAELGGARPGEALKALAVLARTFLISQRTRHAGEGFDFCDTTHCQLYRGEADLATEARATAITSTIDQTAREILSYDGRAIEGYYSAVCGGLSNTPEMVWSGASPSRYPYERISCRWCRASSHYEWERAASALRVLNALAPALKARVSQSAEIIVESDRPVDFVRSVIIRDRSHTARLSAEEFRRAIGRRLGWSTVLSPTFEIKRRGDQFIFHGRGFGSQVGLCQAGAIAQAAAGRSYREILKYYYPQAEITLH